MKKVIAFETGDEIPSSAKFIGTGTRTKKKSNYQEISYPVFYYEVSMREPSSENVQKKEDDSREIISEVISHLNRVTGSPYKATAKANQTVIRARLNDGYTKEELITVIDNMAHDWLEDPRMSQYLRPETLFRQSKIEGYLNHNSVAKQAQKAFDELGEFC